jgi:hypothetical protein
MGYPLRRLTNLLTCEGAKSVIETSGYLVVHRHSNQIYASDSLPDMFCDNSQAVAVV